MGVGYEGANGRSRARDAFRPAPSGFLAVKLPAASLTMNQPCRFLVAVHAAPASRRGSGRSALLKA